jgi:NADPH:quinone reductase-like Zn-dependent oxidoreductase|tara:strand:- start:547 stop:681 length:135 start_codon:yes stop_codon:yes gene_type:complete
VCTKLGAPLELQHDWQLPPLGPTDVRVRIAAAGVNYADLLQACA